MYNKGIELSNLGMRISLIVLVQEFILFSEALVSYWSNRRFSDACLAFQKENLWKAFDYFMKEEYPRDFLDLKLPSETKPKVPSKAKKAGKKVLKRVKQLSLFMKKTVLRFLYQALVFIENTINNLLEVDVSRDYEENKMRN